MQTIKVLEQRRTYFTWHVATWGESRNHPGKSEYRQQPQTLLLHFLI